MIVGTEGPDVMQEEDQDQGEVKETPPSQGQVTDDGGADSPEQQSPAQQSPEQQSPQQQSRSNAKGGGGTGTGTGGTGGGGGGGAGSGGSSGGGSTDPTSDILKSLALAEAMKPLEGPTADLYSPDKEKARKDLEKAYAKGVEDTGDLRVKLKKAHERFDRAASDMVGQRLTDWLKLFDADSALGKLLSERKSARTEFEKTLGANEKARAQAQAETKRWADAFANWSSPVDKMTALVGEYADKIDKLNADINNDVSRDAAMLSFWLEVAPKHLQLDDQPLSGNAKSAVDQVAGVLKNYSLGGKLQNGKARGDGSLYITDDLSAARQGVLRNWIEAAKAQAAAEAAFKEKPDDVATRKQRWDKLRDDAWLSEAKPRLEKNGG